MDNFFFLRRIMTALLVSLDFRWRGMGAYKLTYVPVDLAEEVKNAAVAAPVAIITAGIFLFFYLATAKWNSRMTVQSASRLCSGSSLSSPFVTAFAT